MTAIFVTVPGVCGIHVPISRNVTGQVTQGSNLLTHSGDVVIGRQRGNELDELVLKDQLSAFGAEEHISSCSALNLKPEARLIPPDKLEV